VILTFFFSNIFIQIRYNFIYYLDQGHSHIIDINTAGAGDHAHGYKDVFHSETQRGSPGDHVSVPRNIGSAGSDSDNVGYQMDRGTYNAGNHYHHIHASTGHTVATLSLAGGNQPFDSRSAYTVVRYIIYIQN